MFLLASIDNKVLIFLLAKWNKSGATMVFLLLACTLVSHFFFGDNMLNCWLSDIWLDEISEKFDEDNSELIVGESGSIKGFYFWELLKSRRIKIFSEVAIFFDFWEIFSKPFLVLFFVIWQSWTVFILDLFLVEKFSI